ncbi:hypothetical protein Prudu_244S000200, partial [Prunus dulcis]
PLIAPSNDPTETQTKNPQILPINQTQSAASSSSKAKGAKSLVVWTQRNGKRLEDELPLEANGDYTKSRRRSLINDTLAGHLFVNMLQEDDCIIKQSSYQGELYCENSLPDLERTTEMHDNMQIKSTLQLLSGQRKANTQLSDCGKSCQATRNSMANQVKQ